MPAKDFERLLLDSIDEALSLMGENFKKVVFVQLESLGVPEYVIPRNIGAFTRVIERVFGASSDDLKNLVLRRLYEKNGWPYRRLEFDELTFSEQLERVLGRMYSEIISNMQSPVAVFHLENASHPKFPELLRLSDHLILSQSFAAALTGLTEPAEAVQKLWAEDRVDIISGRIT